MSIASDTIAGVLNASFYDVTEEYAELLEEWYGEDLSLIDHDDEGLAAAVWGLTHSIDYWRTNPARMTPYEKLRIEYQALVEQYQSILEECSALKATVMLLQETRYSLIKKEREKPKNGESIAA